MDKLTTTLSKDGKLGTLRTEPDEEKDKQWQKNRPAKLNASDIPTQARIVEANMLYIDKSDFSARVKKVVLKNKIVYMKTRNSL